jgi:hypothetical protein
MFTQHHEKYFAKLGLPYQYGFALAQIGVQGMYMRKVFECLYHQMRKHL